MLLAATAAKAIKAAAATAAPTLPPLQVQQAPQAAVPHATFFPGWLTHTLGALFIISALALIALLAAQTTKQEGLSGTLGGRVESSYSRLGAEEQLKRITGVAAVAFVVIGTILSLTGL